MKLILENFHSFFIKQKKKINKILLLKCQTFIFSSPVALHNVTCAQTS